MASALALTSLSMRAYTADVFATKTPLIEKNCHRKYSKCMQTQAAGCQKGVSALSEDLGMRTWQRAVEWLRKMP